jgi:hypothetical protein
MHCAWKLLLNARCNHISIVRMRALPCSAAANVELLRFGQCGKVPAYQLVGRLFNSATFRQAVRCVRERT